MSTPNNALCLSSTIKPQKSKVLPHECRICGAPADYLYFGVISCYSCKIFFRRNAKFGTITLLCDFGSQCEININNRHICTSCRLAKCFKTGMNTDKFRASRERKPKQNTLVKGQMEHQPEQLPTLNLLQSDQSSLSTSQWTLLSNLINTFQESNLLSIGQCLVETHNALEPNNVIYQSLIQEFLASIYITTGAYLRLNDDLRNLSSNDRSIILHGAADNVSCLTAAFAMNHCRLLSLEAFSNAMQAMYGKRTIDIHLWAMKFIDPDIILTKLALSLFSVSESACSYSPNVPIELTNALNIFHIQNKYAEITWKYLLYKHGHYQSVKRFLNLTSWLVAITIFMYHAQSLTLHVNDVHALVEQTELSFILEDVDQIVEKN